MTGQGSDFRRAKIAETAWRQCAIRTAVSGLEFLQGHLQRRPSERFVREALGEIVGFLRGVVTLKELGTTLIQLDDDGNNQVPEIKREEHGGSA